MYHGSFLHRLVENIDSIININGSECDNTLMHDNIIMNFIHLFT